MYFVFVTVSPIGSAWGCWIQYRQKQIKSRNNQIQTERNEKSEAVCASQSLRSRRVRQAEEKEGEGVVLEKGNPCSKGEQRDEVTLAKVTREAWAEPQNEARAPETLNHKAILPTPCIFSLSFSFSSSLFKAENVSAEHLQFPKFLLLFPILGFWSQTTPSLSGLALT